MGERSRDIKTQAAALDTTVRAKAQVCSERLAAPGSGAQRRGARRGAWLFLIVREEGAAGSERPRVAGFSF